VLDRRGSANVSASRCNRVEVVPGRLFIEIDTQGEQVCA
jgi:hypothetical protein